MSIVNKTPSTHEQYASEAKQALLQMEAAIKEMSISSFRVWEFGDIETMIIEKLAEIDELIHG